jgi:membrane dipeptidase
VSGKPRFGTFDFGLDDEAEARARQLHAQSIVIDGMYFGPITHLGFPRELERRINEAEERDALSSRATTPSGRNTVFREAAYGRFQDFREIWDESGITAGEFGVQIGSAESLLRSAAHLDLVFDGLSWLTRARRAEDIRQAKHTGGHALFLHCQPSVPISQDLGLIELAYDVGLRGLQLTYNMHDFVGAGCTDRSGAGLSDFGVQVIRLLNGLRILVDVSHASMRTILDACEVSERPVIATHTAARGVYHHDRCITDEAIKAIAATGGTIGVVTVPFFLSAGNSVDMNDVLNHIDYIGELVGPEHVAVGTDWPLGETAASVERFVRDWAPEHGFRPEHNVTSANVIGFDDHRDFRNFTRGLVARGYTDEQIRGIIGENFLKVFEEVCG